MINYPQVYDPYNPIIPKDDGYYERHILNLGSLGSKLLQLLSSLFGTYVESQDIIRFVYNETFAQMVLSMDGSLEEYYLRLIALPNYEMFRHLKEFNDPQIRHIYRELFNTIGTELGQLVYQETNPLGHQAQYFCDAVTSTYIIIVKSYPPGYASSVANNY